MAVITAQEKLVGEAEHDDDEVQAKCYSRQLILLHHPKGAVNDGKRFDYLPCFRDGMRGRGIVVASCGNLMLCSRSHDDDYDEGVYYLCNPYTKQWMELPPAPSKGQAVLGMTCDPLVVDNDNDRVVPPKGLGEGVGLKPRHSESCALFMGQLTRQRFRVVRVPMPVVTTNNGGGGGGFKVEMLSCDDRGTRWGWNEVRVLPPRPLEWREPKRWFMRRHAVACNGLLHWLVGYTEQLLVYDPYTNEVKAIVERPSEALGFVRSLCLLGASCGSVWVAQSVQHYYPFDDWLIWQVGPDYHQGWTLRHRFQEVFVTGFFQMRLRAMEMMNLLAIHPSNSNVVYVLWSKHTFDRGFENVVGRVDLATMKLKLVGSKTSSNYSWHKTCVLTLPTQTH